ncbi:hypothetical protein STAL104432_29575 [Streptomyces albus]
MSKSGVPSPVAGRGGSTTTVGREEEEGSASRGSDTGGGMRTCSSVRAPDRRRAAAVGLAPVTGEGCSEKTGAVPPSVCSPRGNSVEYTPRPMRWARSSATPGAKRSSSETARKTGTAGSRTSSSGSLAASSMNSPAGMRRVTPPYVTKRWPASVRSSSARITYGSGDVVPPVFPCHGASTVPPGTWTFDRSTVAFPARVPSRFRPPPEEPGADGGIRVASDRAPSVSRW